MGIYEAALVLFKAALYVLAPLGLGGGGGWGCFGRNHRRAPGAVVWGVLGGAHLVALAVLWAGLPLPFSDALLLTWLFWAGFVGAARPWSWPGFATVLLGAGMTLVCAVVLELVVASYLPDPRFQPMPAAELSLLEPDLAVSHKARHMVYAKPPKGAAGRLGSEPLVVHASDSIGLPPHAFSRDGHSFIDYLDRLDPKQFHLRTSVGGTGPDYYALLVLNWVASHSVTSVIVHLSVPGDLVDTGKPYEFCGPGPLLEDRRAEIRFRCPRGPAPGGGLDSLFATPAPYPVRAMSLFSTTARHLAGHWLRASRNIRTYDWPVLRKEQVMWSVLDYLHRALRDRQIPLTIVIHPHRTSIGGGEQSQALVNRWRARLAQLGIRVVDPTQMLVEAVREHGDAVIYQNHIPMDGHYSDLGHRLMAEFLAAKLAP